MPRYEKFNMRALLYGLMLLMTFVSLSVNAEITSADTRPKVSIEKHKVEESKEIISDIKSAPPFVNIVEERVWSYKKDEADNVDEATEDELAAESEIDSELGWLLGLINILSVIIEFIFWVTPLFIGWYLYRHRAYWLAFIDKRNAVKNMTTLPDTLFGLDVRRDQLPENIEGFAQQLWSNNQKRDAVSLLYRGALVFLFNGYRFSLPLGATEHDCIGYLESSNNAQPSSDADENLKITTQQTIKQFKHITDIWIKLAYAHKLPSDEEFNEIVNGWNDFFKISETKNYR